MKARTKVNLCHCNNCEATLMDTNPKDELHNLHEINIEDYKELGMGEVDGEIVSHCCPNCKTDAYLSDTLLFPPHEEIAISKNKTKIAIVIDGGMVRGIHSNNSDVQIVVIDHDNFDVGNPPCSEILNPGRVSNNIYELYNDYSPVQDAEIHHQLKRLHF